jgi:1,6-anhydro-N-acetylmuramate kinase
VADAFRRFIPEPVTELLVSGGGAENPALLDALTEALQPVKVQRFADVYFDGEAKEAVAFALLGKLFLDGKPGNVVTVTGARGPRRPPTPPPARARRMQRPARESDRTGLTRSRGATETGKSLRELRGSA